MLADIVLDYFKGYGVDLVSANGTQSACGRWVDFFGEDSVEEATHPRRMEEFVAHLISEGYSTAYLQRILGVGT